MLPECNISLSLTTTDDFEVQIDDSTDAVERHALFLPATSPCAQLVAQGVAVPGDTCKPASARTQEIGCWILADNPVGQLTKPQVFWHLDAYRTRLAAQADKGPRGTVIESFGKVCG
jgi:hypothetical protein